MSFEPIIDSHSKILILGSYPSPISFKMGFYYGFSKNRFWKVLTSVLKTSAPETNEQKKVFLLEHKIALWDVLASCKVDGASDASIREGIPNAIFDLLEKYPQIEMIFTNGRTAHKLYKQYFGKKIEIESYNLPSTSPANARYNLESLTKEWMKIGEKLDE